jgi:hypothetical protein
VRVHIRCEKRCNCCEHSHANGGSRNTVDLAMSVCFEPVREVIVIRGRFRFFGRRSASAYGCKRKIGSRFRIFEFEFDLLSRLHVFRGFEDSLCG